MPLPFRRPGGKIRKAAGRKAFPAAGNAGRIGKTALSLCLSLSLALFPGNVVAAAPLRVAVLGDSIARGYGCAPEEAYGSLLADRLRERYAGKGIDVSFQNGGVDGQTSGELLESLENPETGALQTAVGADILAVSIGGNDLLHCLDGRLWEAAGVSPDSASPGSDFLARLKEEGGQALTGLLSALVRAATDGEFTAALAEAAAGLDANVDRLLDFLAGRNPDGIFILTTIPNPAVGTWMENAADLLLEKFNGVLRSKADGERVFVADCAAAFASYEGEEALSFTCLDWTRPTAWSADPHPTPAGHRLMAERHLLAVQETADALAAARAETRTAPSAPPAVGGPSASARIVLPLAAAGIFLGACAFFLVRRKRRKKRGR
ncbi:MAG TPA: hypothetical protein H9684_01490 [Firmicutes bacterium]|nr:hypothetical protein [Bacillota bacterium]